MPWQSSSYPLTDHATQSSTLPTIILEFVVPLLFCPLMKTHQFKDLPERNVFPWASQAGFAQIFWCLPIGSSKSNTSYSVTSADFKQYQVKGVHFLDFPALSTPLLKGPIISLEKITSSYWIIEKRCNFWKLNLLLIKNPAAPTGLWYWSETRIGYFKIPYACFFFSPQIFTSQITLYDRELNPKAFQ